ncbi:armadillo-type protein [Roridomyces roridus]|uniref:AP complex subunit beta n=1 Tax=Roridomyces roridus TaxID=1738132 RepID=A0AAD7BT83_9AGAR|nr:armadillo-type protein [Roridomyces roridus]
MKYLQMGSSFLDDVSALIVGIGFVVWAENYELSVDLNSGYPEKRKDAIKRTIASMTVGKDTDDLEQKKLVYLYLMNYAKSQPELVILAVNTFVKDSDDPNPLVRALAIRTMGVLRAEKIIDYLCDPLQKCLRDENPYVRKTAALCVAKLYDLKPELVIENGFLEQLHDMISDSNPMVVANTVAALTDIHISASAQPSSSTSDPGIFNISASILNKFEHICERVVPQFQHVNGSVVLAAMKVIMIHIRGVRREELIKTLVRKMAPPLVTLLSAPPEVQWVALRNINLLLQKRPEILSSELRVFFCKYNDPLYVKIEKLDIMVRLASEHNVDPLLSELKEYASEVDVDFVRKSIKAIGQTAVKIDAAAERCVNVLLELIDTRVSYVVQEAVVVMKDIFRKYPATYEGIIPTLCANLDELDEPEAKASLIWIIGEYASKIDNADELLNIFVDTFAEESYAVQLQTLTAVRVLNTATNCDSPDVRDRAYIYWRLLSTDPGAAKAVVLSNRPPISIPRTTVAPALLEELLGELSSLSSVYHKPSETFTRLGPVGADSVQRKGTGEFPDEDQFSAKKALQTVAAGQQAENLLDFGDDLSMDGQPSGLAATQVLHQTPAAASLMSGMSSNPLDDLVSIFGNASVSPTPAVAASNPMAAFGGSGFGIAAPAATSPPLVQSPTQQQPQEDLLGLF